MQLAVVQGQCTATVKDASLGSRRLALVRTVDADGSPLGPVEVALDVTAAAIGQTVLVARGSAARLPAETRQVATDLAIVAIVDEITVAPSSGPPDRRARTSSRPGRRGAKEPEEQTHV